MNLILGNTRAEIRPIMVAERAMEAAERVSCEICLKEIPRSEAAMAEARGYVAYFLGAPPRA